MIPLIPVQVPCWLEPILAAQGTRWAPTLDSTPYHRRVHTHPHTHTHWEWDMFGMREETGGLEKTHTDMRRTGKLYTDSGPCQKSFVFPHQSYNKTMLFEDLLYFLLFLFYILFFGKFIYSHFLCNSPMEMTQQSRVLPKLQT